MTADNRSVATDALATLGTIIDDTQKRDAIHLAVEPVIAGEKLHPAESVFLKDGRAFTTGGEGKYLGIVDPFLFKSVREGERFWLVVYPRQITSLRHVWEHPDFPASGETGVVSTDKAVSEQWLRDYCERSDCPDYDTVLRLATGEEITLHEEYSASHNDGEYINVYGKDAHAEIPPEFWTHVEIVSGKKIPQNMRATYFSCSC